MQPGRLTVQQEKYKANTSFTLDLSFECSPVHTGVWVLTMGRNTLTQPLQWLSVQFKFPLIFDYTVPDLFGQSNTISDGQ
jgi:hypothetical protein